MTIDELLCNDRWKNGPDFLSQPEEFWPKSPVNTGQVSDQDPEIKNSSASAASESNGKKDLYVIFEKFSGWTRLKRVISWLLRYKRNLLSAHRLRKEGKAIPNTKSAKQLPPLTVDEMREAEREILHYIQVHEFREIKQVLVHHSNDHGERKFARKIKKSSNIYKLDPILEDGLLRVGGRLEKAPLQQDAKHPIILPKHHHISELIIRHYHCASGHSGLEYTLSLIRERYWIIGARSTIRRCLNSCVSCRKRQAPALQQKMANLPESRLSAYNPPFSRVGVDCFGPFIVRRGRSNVKRYGVLFTCLSIRAIHIEIANSLDSDSFINALRRFISRRGMPCEIISDNGGNFVKGEKELKQAIDNWNQAQTHAYLSQQNVQWLFNPPAASHHGGVWERCLRTVRKVLAALMHQQVLDDKALSTLMCEVESIVNGRPLTKISDDPCDSEPLTQNHLLLLRKGSKAPP